MSGRIKKWQFWCHVFAPLMEQEPEFFPLLVRWHSQVEIPSCCQQLALPPLRYTPWRWTQDRSRRVPSVDPVHVLFDPVCERPNCLGACRKLAAQLPPSRSYAYVKLAHRKLAFGESERVIDVYTALQQLQPQRIQYLIRMMWKRFEEVDKSLLWTLVRHLPRLGIWLAIIQIRINEARKSLLNHGVEWFITPNEQSALSSIFLVASKLQGVRFVQFLHGIPCALYTPFWSDEFWVWGSTTKQMLDSALDWRAESCLAVGALEFAGASRLRGACRPSLTESSQLTLLLLAQDVGDRIWETTAYSDSYRLVAEAVSKCPGWRVVLRSHPQASPRERQAMQAEFIEKGIEVAFSHQPLDRDVENSDFVCTASSSAILQALLACKPVKLVWSKGLDMIHGGPFLPVDHVVYSSEELALALSEEYAESIDQPAIRKVLGEDDPAQWMAERMC